MRTYQIQLTDDLTVPVRANSQEEAVQIIKAEILKKEASPLFDQTYFDYETGINVPSLRATLARQEKRTEKENVLRAYVDSSGKEHLGSIEFDELTDTTTGTSDFSMDDEEEFRNETQMDPINVQDMILDKI